MFLETFGMTTCHIFPTLRICCVTTQREEDILGLKGICLMNTFIYKTRLLYKTGLVKAEKVERFAKEKKSERAKLF